MPILYTDSSRKYSKPIPPPPSSKIQFFRQKSYFIPPPPSTPPPKLQNRSNRIIKLQNQSKSNFQNESIAKTEPSTGTQYVSYHNNNFNNFYFQSPGQLFPAQSNGWHQSSSADNSSNRQIQRQNNKPVKRNIPQRIISEEPFYRQNNQQNRNYQNFESYPPARFNSFDNFGQIQPSSSDKSGRIRQDEETKPSFFDNTIKNPFLNPTAHYQPWYSQKPDVNSETTNFDEDYYQNNADFEQNKQDNSTAAKRLRAAISAAKSAQSFRLFKDRSAPDNSYQDRSAPDNSYQDRSAYQNQRRSLPSDQLNCQSGNYSRDNVYDIYEPWRKKQSPWDYDVKRYDQRCGYDVSRYLDNAAVEKNYYNQRSGRELDMSICKVKKAQSGFYGGSVAKASEFNKKMTGRIIRPGKRRARKMFSDEEVNNLIHGVEQFGEGKWARILQFYDFDDRTAVDLKDKWRNLQKPSSTVKVPKDRRTRLPYTDSECRMLRCGVQVFGHNWVAILRAFSFNSERTTVDLKDKWRNLQIKSGLINPPLKNPRRFLLLDSDNSIFRSVYPRDAALKAASRGFEYIKLLQIGTPRIHVFAGERKLVQKYIGRERGSVWKGRVLKLGMERANVAQLRVAKSRYAQQFGLTAAHEIAPNVNIDLVKESNGGGTKNENIFKSKTDVKVMSELKLIKEYSDYIDQPVHYKEGEFDTNELVKSFQ